MGMPWRKTALAAGLGAIALLASTLVASPAGAVSGGAVASGPGYVAKLTNSAASCTGVLVNPSWVLPSGGCFGPAGVRSDGYTLPTTVVIGRSQLTASTGHQVTAGRVIPHPTRDLALVGLSEPV